MNVAFENASGDATWLCFGICLATSFISICLATSFISICLATSFISLMNPLIMINICRLSLEDDWKLNAPEKQKIKTKTTTTTAAAAAAAATTTTTTTTTHTHTHTYTHARALARTLTHNTIGSTRNPLNVQLHIPDDHQSAHPGNATKITAATATTKHNNHPQLHRQKQEGTAERCLLCETVDTVEAAVDDKVFDLMPSLNHD